MELRKCECGSTDQRIFETVTWKHRVICYGCTKMTNVFWDVNEAIQAWNEGKVE